MLVLETVQLIEQRLKHFIQCWHVIDRLDKRKQGFFEIHLNPHILFMPNIYLLGLCVFSKCQNRSNFGRELMCFRSKTANLKFSSKKIKRPSRVLAWAQIFQRTLQSCIMLLDALILVNRIDTTTLGVALHGEVDIAWMPVFFTAFACAIQIIRYDFLLHLGS